MTSLQKSTIVANICEQKSSSALFISQGTHGTGKTGKMATTKSLSGKTQGIWKFYQNMGNLVCSSCKFPDSKGKGYCDI